MNALTTIRSGLPEPADRLPDSAIAECGVNSEPRSGSDETISSGPLSKIGAMSRQTLISLVTPDGTVLSIPLVDWEQTSRAIDSVGYLTLKRVMDVVGAAIGLILLSPFMLFAMFLVWLEDGGPVVFRQTRVGLHGKRFQIYKIRSMVKNAEDRLEEVAALNRHEDQRTFKADNDPRILRVGRLLRKYSIDEFPQLLNVLRGEMSLVGPRPPLSREVDLYEPADYVRLAVKPGLTCYWQVSGRGTIAFKGQVELDRQYIHEASTLVDIALIAKTLPAMFKGVGAH